MKTPSAKTLKTKGGFEISVSRHSLPTAQALEQIYAKIDTRRGAIFSSGFDFPGRHSRWDIGFVDPALEFISRKRAFEVRALNAQGEALLELLAPTLRQHAYILKLSETKSLLSGEVRAPDAHFPEEQRSRQSSVFSVLRAIVGAFQPESPTSELPHLGLYGALGYDLVMQFESIELKHARSEELRDCHLFLPLALVVIDRQKEAAEQISFSIETPRGATSELSGGGESFSLSPGAGSNEIVSDHKPGAFADKVRHIIEGTKRGDYFEVILSQTFETRFEEPPSQLFDRLTKLNPSPYMFLINFGKDQLVGSSPEIYMRTTGKRIETCPISGTVPRGLTALEDADRVRELIMSEKEDSELTMCTDVDRNDMARVCVPGSVRIIGRRQLEFYSHLIHTVDHLEGILDDKFDTIDAFQMHMWACTVTGAPKPAAIQEIENMEASPRGWYSGAVGFFLFDGNINTGITLRTAHLKNGRASVRAGATLLYGSEPDREEAETQTKARAFLVALTSGRKEQKASSPGASVQVVSTFAPAAHGKKILLMDCRDSFVHNLASYLRECGAQVVTYRPGFPESILDTEKPNLVLLSPGPFDPEHFGIPDFVRRLAARKMPTFGVCLGHQGIGQAFGATLGQLPVPVHGKVATVVHKNTSFFEGLPTEFEVGRYHSLYLVESSLPSSIEVLARTKSAESVDTTNGVVMAIRHRELPIAGVQFHPESLMTLKEQAGHKLLANVLRLIA